MKTIKKIGQDCVFCDGLWELKDTESKFFMIFDCEDDAKKLKSYLDKKDRESTILKKALELACDFMEEKCDWNCNSLVVYSTKKEIYDYFIEQAKESIKDV